MDMEKCLRELKYKILKDKGYSENQIIDLIEKSERDEYDITVSAEKLLDLLCEIKDFWSCWNICLFHRCDKMGALRQKENKA